MALSGLSGLSGNSGVCGGTLPYTSGNYLTAADPEDGSVRLELDDPARTPDLTPGVDYVALTSSVYTTGPYLVSGVDSGLLFIETTFSGDDAGSWAKNV